MFLALLSSPTKYTYCPVSMTCLFLQLLLWQKCISVTAAIQQGAHTDGFTLMSYSSTCFVLKTCNLEITDSTTNLGESNHCWGKNVISVQFVCSVCLLSSRLVWIVQQSWIHPECGRGEGTWAQTLHQLTWSTSSVRGGPQLFSQNSNSHTLLNSVSWGIRDTKSPVTCGLQSLPPKMT